MEPNKLQQARAMMIDEDEVDNLTRRWLDGDIDDRAYDKLKQRRKQFEARVDWAMKNPGKIHPDLLDRYGAIDPRRSSMLAAQEEDEESFDTWRRNYELEKRKQKYPAQPDGVKRAAYEAPAMYRTTGRISEPVERY